MSLGGPQKLLSEGLTPWLTGAGSRRLEGTNIGHENAEGMAYVGVRVEPTVRLGSVGRACEVRLTKHDSLGDDVKVEVCNVLKSRPVANKPIVRMTCFGHVSFCERQAI